MELEEINIRFNRELRKQIDGELPKGHIYYLGYPSEKLLATGLPGLPIELSADRLAKKASESYGHPFNILDLENLPKAINEPIMIFHSTKKDGSKLYFWNCKAKEEIMWRLLECSIKAGEETIRK